MGKVGTRIVSSRNRWLVLMLRAIGLLDLAALIAVFSPRNWIAASHEWLGMGDFSSGPIVGYLARCTSTWYATYGLPLWFVSCDVQKYAFLIRCLAWVMFIQGLFIVGIDVAEGMPTWWIAIEGPCCSGFGACLLLLQRQQSAPSPNEI